MTTGRRTPNVGPLRYLLGIVLLLTAIPSQVSGQNTSTGTMHVVWDGEADPTYYIVDGQGVGQKLILDDAGSGVASYLSLDRRPVELSGARVASTGSNAGLSALRATGVHATARTASNAGEVRKEPRDFVTLLCRFADEPEPFTREQVADVHGGQYPGVRHYFAELSWDPSLMAGSKVTGWYLLPKPRTAYVSDLLTDFGALARDCTAAADDDVDFAAFYGINLQFSGGLSRRVIQPYDTLSFGGSWTLSLDGVTRSWGMTWLSAGHAMTRAVIAHEMGHALGWPHSSGGNGSEYDSEWDVMSRGYLRWEPPHGWLSVHTIAHHKDAVGWIPSHRRWIPTEGSQESAVIVRTALPPEKGYLLARVPAGDSHYTVEVRRQAGHDQPLPGDAVVIHQVRFGVAKVVTADGNTDPNGPGAQWLPGEEYHDQSRGLSIRVDSAATDGFHVSITRGWRLDIASDGPGRVIARTAGASHSCDSLCSLVVADRGARVQLEPLPETAAAFSHWEGACGSSAAMCELTLDRNRSVSAVFRQDVAMGETLLGRATVGEFFQARLALPSYSASAAWRVTHGNLPKGVQFDAEQLILRGVAIEAGSFSFALGADSGEASSMRYRLDVTPPTLTSDAVVDHLVSGSALRAVDVQYLDYAGNRNGRLDIGDLRHWLLEQVRAGTMASGEAQALRQLVEAVQ